MEPTASNTYNGIFDGKTKPQIERSIRAHRGALTKLFRYLDTACNAVTVLPTSKGARGTRWKKKSKKLRQDTTA